MNEDKDIAYELRVMSKRQDLPNDVIRTLAEAYAEIVELRSQVSKYALAELSRFDQENGLI
jgi:hypothetical protein